MDNFNVLGLKVKMCVFLQELTKKSIRLIWLPIVQA